MNCFTIHVRRDECRYTRHEAPDQILFGIRNFMGALEMRYSVRSEFMHE